MTASAGWLVELGREAVLARGPEDFHARADGIVPLAARDPGTARAVAELAVAVAERGRDEAADRRESLVRLATGVAHDLNNLLGVIINFAALVSDELPPGGQAAEDLEQIREAAREAVALSERLAVIAGDRRRDAETVRLQERLAGLERTASPGVEVEVRIAATRSVQLDRDVFDAIVAELMANACGAMPDGGRVLVEARDEGEVVRLTVSDDGHGMDSDVAARAAEPYFTTSAYGRGAGLGLATVHGWLIAVGGALELESAPGAGTSVHVLLPAAQAG